MHQNEVQEFLYRMVTRCRPSTCHCKRDSHPEISSPDRTQSSWLTCFQTEEKVASTNHLSFNPKSLSNNLQKLDALSKRSRPSGTCFQERRGGPLGLFLRAFDLRRSCLQQCGVLLIYCTRCLGVVAGTNWICEIPSHRSINQQIDQQVESTRLSIVRHISRWEGDNEEG